MKAEITRIIFSDYFWTPVPFIILMSISLLEIFLFKRFFKAKELSVSFVLKILASNIIIYFSEYWLSNIINGGHILLVWIPWVKQLDPQDSVNYFLSFPIIFIATFLGETILNTVFFGSKYGLKKICYYTFTINLISTILVIITYNLVIFNFIKGINFVIFDNGFNNLN